MWEHHTEKILTYKTVKFNLVGYAINHNSNIHSALK